MSDKYTTGHNYITLQLEVRSLEEHLSLVKGAIHEYLHRPSTVLGDLPGLLRERYETEERLSKLQPRLTMERIKSMA